MSVLRRASWLVAALAVTAAFAVPIAVMITGSLRLPGLPPPRALELLPDPVTLEPYRRAVATVPLARALVNSAVVAAVFVPIAVLTASWAGFAIVSVRARARRVLVASAIVVMSVPVTALWIARFAGFEALGLTGTYVPLIAPALMGGTPFAILLYAVAFWRLPREVLDAARMEGAGPLRIWRRVAMPLVRPATAAVAVLAFVQSWANFIDPLLYLDRPDTYTAPLVLQYLQQLGSTNFSVLLAGSVLVAAPALVAFVLVQRRLFKEASA